MRAQLNGTVRDQSSLLDEALMQIPKQLLSSPTTLMSKYILTSIRNRMFFLEKLRAKADYIQFHSVRMNLCRADVAHTRTDGSSETFMRSAMQGNTRLFSSNPKLR